MQATLTNSKITAVIDSHGGELISLRSNKNNLEYLWQGDPAYWSGHAPVLFPIVGSLRGGTATLPDNRICRMGRHGLARRQAFKTLRRGDANVLLRTTSDAKTAQQFPYSYELDAAYTIRGASIATKLTVRNTGRETMPYCIGGHPAFNCPLLPGEHFGEYVIEFDECETAYCMYMDTKTGLFTASDRRCMINNRRTLPLSRSLFENDTLVFDALNSRGVLLYHPIHGHGVRLDFPGFPYLGIWSAADSAPFVALEPWHGMSTCSDEDDCFLHKRAVTLLKPGCERCHTYVITVLD